MTGFIIGVVLVIALVAIAIVAFVYFGSRGEQSETTTHTETPKEGGAPNELDLLFDQLADALLELKLSDASKEVFDKAMLVVDRLYELLPKFIEKHGSTELAFVLVQVGKNYLPNLLIPYSEMSRTAQQNKESELVDALALLLDQIKKIEESYDKGEEDRFETEATFLKKRFLGESIEAS